ncbi:hypothetical protein DH2020_028657 [Rehmannia glutinosa]|uniref:D-isomer specific 2-hydroxyacid dehydrogenase NAD-binding domain-containing protein n=1 Tax=Rehmannia glutinosa TaxID=99300 RepID=A0ABR0VQS0_REHGL
MAGLKPFPVDYSSPEHETPIIGEQPPTVAAANQCRQPEQKLPLLLLHRFQNFKYPAIECVIGTITGINHFDLAAVAAAAVASASRPRRRLSDDVSGKRVGIVGLGNIGSRIAKRFEAFGCTIAYNSRNIKSHATYTYYANIVDLASNIDILIVCCALTNETYHVINKDVMTALGKTGIIVNVGRGALIDENELVEFLVRGEIGGAGLDVFEHEPRVPEELLALDNVVLSPHRAAFTSDSFQALEKLVLHNLHAFFSNEPLKTEIRLD